MKKCLVVVLVILMTFITTNVNALTIDFDTFKGLNIQHAYIIGDYIFDSSNGFTPSLKDILDASRSIPNGEKTTLYDIIYMPSFNYYSSLEVYSKEESTSSDEFKGFSCKYVYSESIGTTNYITLD